MQKMEVSEMLEMIECYFENKYNKKVFAVCDDGEFVYADGMENLLEGKQKKRNPPKKDKY